MKKKWNVSDIPDQSGKMVIITGANRGLGFAATRILAMKGAHIIMACRNMEKAEVAKDLILEEYPNSSLEIILLDLADLSSIKKFALVYSQKFQRLDILLNNAGAIMVPRQETVDGFELQFGVNHLGHFALTGLFLEVLLKAENSRIVNMSSTAHRMGKIDFEDVGLEHSYSKMGAYGRSKLANLLFTYELQRKLEKSDSSTICMASHPGWTLTNREKMSLIGKIFGPIFGQKPHMGILPMLYGATSPDARVGAYYGPNGILGIKGYPKEVMSNKKSHNLNDAKKLWELSEELTGIRYPI